MHISPLLPLSSRLKHPRASACILLVLSPVVSACAGFATVPSDSSPTDAGGVDATGVDATAPDATEIDAAALDASDDAPESGLDDGMEPDAADASQDGPMDAGPIACGRAQLECDGGCVSEDIANCGQCGKACPAPAHAVATCVVSAGQYACGSSCASGYSSCPSAGCVDLQTDNKNCGRCGHGCLGGTCSAGRCTSWQVTAVTPNGEALGGQRAGVYGHAAMATDGKSVVWIDVTNGILEKPLVGSSSASPITLSANTSGNPYGWGLVAMAKGTVAWTTWDANNPIQLWTSKDSTMLGGQVTASIPGSGGDYPTGLALDAAGANAYFVDALNNNGAPANAGLYGCVLSSKNCTVLRTVAPSPEFSIGDDVATSTGIFYTDTTEQLVYRQNVGTLATGQINASLLAADSTNLYWATIGIPDAGATTFSILKASQAGTFETPTTILQPQTGAIWGMATDGVNVYFIDDPASGGNHGGALLYVPVGGGTPQSLKDGQQAIAVATGGGAIVWIDTNTNTINAIAAP